jgi:SAM-dependent methyltransferase
MRAKPKHLGPEYAAQFADDSVAGAYHHRIPYPPDVFAILAGLLGDGPRAVLDVGCGTGEIARPLLPLVDRVDAVDPSAAMIARGRALPGGDYPRLRWIVGRAEDAPLDPPYGLITAGSSIHWLDWDVALPRFRRLLAAHGCLALLSPEARPVPWAAELQRIIDRYSTNRDYAPYDIVTELASRGLFHVRGTQATAPISFAQPIAGYVESFHAMNGFSRERMTLEAAAEFDAAVRALLAPFCPDGQVHLEVVATVTWGVPGCA